MRTLIAPVVIAALFFTGVYAAPVRAQDNDAAKVLAGLAALAVIGIAIDRRNDRREEEEARQASRVYTPAPVVRRDDYRHHDNRYGQKKSKGKKRSVRYALPSRCLRTFETRRGVRDLYGAGCLRRNNDRLASLPERCERRAFTNRGTRLAYSPRCLSDAGFFRVRG